MGILEDRESEINLKLSIDSKKAYKTLINAFNQDGLNLKSEDKPNLSAVAETSKLKAMASNSYGEVVSFFITEVEQEGCCFVRLSSRGSFPAGSYSHKDIFFNIQDFLKKNIGAESVKLTVQRGEFYIDEETILKDLDKKIDRNTIRKLAEKNSDELQDVSNLGGNIYQKSLEQQDKVNEYVATLNDTDAVKFMTMYSEELSACSNKKIDDANEILNEVNINNQNTEIIGNIIGFVILCVVLFFIFK